MGIDTNYNVASAQPVYSSDAKGLCVRSGPSIARLMTLDRKLQQLPIDLKDSSLFKIDTNTA